MQDMRKDFPGQPPQDLASALELIGSLEAALERAQAELTTLRDELQQAHQQLQESDVAELVVAADEHFRNWQKAQQELQQAREEREGWMMKAGETTFFWQQAEAALTEAQRERDTVLANQWECQDCGEKWELERRFSFSYCPKCHGGFTRPALRLLTEIRVQLTEAQGKVTALCEKFGVTPKRLAGIVNDYQHMLALTAPATEANDARL